MEGFDRLYDLHRVLAARRGPISTQDLLRQLECSRPTLHRTITHLRDFLGAPIRNTPGVGYFYEHEDGEVFSIPGLWFTASELKSLLIMHALLKHLEPGLLDGLIAPFRKRIDALISQASTGALPFPIEKVRVLAMYQRRHDPIAFQTVANALADRKRLHLIYRGRARDAQTERDVSPQRLVYYRDNWYLDAWCHTRRALRVFALDRILNANAAEPAAIEVADSTLDRELATSYGIFAGEPKFVALLRFTPERARWVADEFWHPQQRGQFTTDGSYELEVPYGDARELIGEVLRHGSQVEVVAPKGLRLRVGEDLIKAANRYR